MAGIDINVKARGRMRINEAARAAGVSARSLRHYEAQGLLAPRRDDLGYRVYGSADIEVAKGVQALIAAGFSTNEIAQIAPWPFVGRRCLNALSQVRPGTARKDVAYRRDDRHPAGCTRCDRKDCG